MNACAQTDLMLAVHACVEHAKSVLFRNIGDVAAAMQTNPTRDAVYKWVQTGRMPLAEIAEFERVCGANHISAYLARCGGSVLVKAPVAEGLCQLDFARIQCQVAKAVLATSTALVDPAQTHDAMNAINVAVQGLLAARQQIANGGLK